MAPPGRGRRPLTKQATALSISRPAREWLRQSYKDQPPARVLATFERTCDLITKRGEVVALATAPVGDGPLNIVVDGTEGLFTGVKVGEAARMDGRWLRAGDLNVDMGNAPVWEPRPDWDALRARQAAVDSGLPLVRDLSLRHAPAESLMLLLDACRPSGGDARHVFAVARKAAETLREGWRGRIEKLQEGTAQLAGLGGGLTPAGDDFLAGAMLWAWLAHPTPEPVCRAVSEAAAPRTATLSAAFLRAAGRGECSAWWHALLAGLGDGAEAKITTAVREITRHGATSGADSLAGFLYSSQDR